MILNPPKWLPNFSKYNLSDVINTPILQLSDGTKYYTRK
jgi:hypothetical protein